MMFLTRLAHYNIFPIQHSKSSSNKYVTNIKTGMAWENTLKHTIFLRLTHSRINTLKLSKLQKVTQKLLMIAWNIPKRGIEIY